MLLSRGPLLSSGGQALELAYAHASVRRASKGEVAAALRLYRPANPVVVFGRRETRAPGFREACALATEAGFEVAVRATGGRAVAYTERSVVVDHVERAPDATAGMDDRFEGLGHLIREALVGLGVDARLGAVPGEYCPGAHSVNARGTVKLVGTSQRVVREAWLFSALVVVDDADRVRSLLTGVYRALGQPLEGASVGALADEVPGLDAEAVEAALVDAYARAHDLTAEAPDPVTLDAAEALVAEHRIES